MRCEEPSSGRVISGLEEMWASRWSAAIRIRRRSSQKTVSEGLWPGRCRACRVRSRKSIASPSASGRVTAHVRAPAAEAAGDAAQRRRHFLGDAVAQHQLDREAVLRLGVVVEVGEPLGGDPERRHLGAGVLDDDLDQAEVVDVLVGDDHQLEVVDRVAAGGELAAELVQRFARVGAGVDQGQRLVLDQVAVDPPDRERGRDPEAVDAGQRGLLQRLLGGEAHARISPSSSSRRCSMSSRETSDSRLRRSSGSVFEGRTLKCQSG